MEAGYIGVSRRFFGNFLWTEKRVFSRAEAWLDLLAEAWYGDEPGKEFACGRAFTVNRGEVLRSLDEWAGRWGWSKSAVNRFFNLLEKEQMIVCVNEMRTTRLLVVNYDVYNPSEKSSSKNGKKSGTAAERQPERLKGDKSTACADSRNGGETATGTAAERSRNDPGTPIKEERKNLNITTTAAEKNEDWGVVEFPVGWRSMELAKAFAAYVKMRNGKGRNPLAQGSIDALILQCVRLKTEERAIAALLHSAAIGAWNLEEPKNMAPPEGAELPANARRYVPFKSMAEQAAELMNVPSSAGKGR